MLFSALVNNCFGAGFLVFLYLLLDLLALAFLPAFVCIQSKNHCSHSYVNLYPCRA